MKVTPIEYKVLVKPLDIEQVTSGGIIIPETAREKWFVAQEKAVIIATGGNAFEDMKKPLPRVGDMVLVNRYAGTFFTDKETREKYKIVNDKDITAILEE